MFTGIIATVGRIAQVIPLAGGVRLAVAATGLDMSDVKPGDSIAVNGVCLTAVDLFDGGFHADVSRATLDCTVGLESPGDVNLEKALRLADRLGGHLVTGHVDGIGRVTTFAPVGESWLLTVQAPAELGRYIARKGSVTVNGVSLTVNRVEGASFDINIIPHTREVTTFRALAQGDAVNVEIDLMARYVERMIAADGGSAL